MIPSDGITYDTKWWDYLWYQVMGPLIPSDGTYVTKWWDYIDETRLLPIEISYTNNYRMRHYYIDNYYYNIRELSQNVRRYKKLQYAIKHLTRNI